jgi:hypothetical protein
MNKYFVSYHAFNDGRLVRVGNSDISYPLIKSGIDVEQIQKEISKNLQPIVSCNQVVIINWKRFEEVV